MKYDFNYIIDYMINYDSGVPISVTIGLSFIVCVIIVILYHYNTDGFIFLKNASWCILSGYLFFVFFTTILFRNSIKETQYILRPLWSYEVLYDRLLAQNILNVLMFIPIGFLASCSLRGKGGLKIIGTGCGLSLTIEFLQLVTKRGVFNIDDIIHNTLGCAIGYAAFRLCNSHIRPNMCGRR